MPTTLHHLNAAAAATKKFLARSAHHSSHQHGKTPSIRSTGSYTSIDSGYHSDPDTMDLLKRHSISLGRTKKEKSKSEDSTPSLAKLDFVVESPPLLSYGHPEESSGALFSGQFRVNVLNKPQLFDSIEVRLYSVTTFKRPIASHCDECGGKKEELKKWTFVQEPNLLSQGEHKFPVSYLFPGNLPATTHSHYALIDYQFVAIVKPHNHEPVFHQHPIDLKRAIRPGNERQSVRVFPPTNMTASVKLTPVIYTDSEIPVALRLSGIKTSTEKTETRWRLRRLLWRVDEFQKIVSTSCPKHRAKIPEGQTGIKHDEVKTVGEGEVSWNKNPWKTDLSAGEVDSEFIASIQPKYKPIVGVRSDSISLQVWHHLIIEMIVVEEFIQKRHPTRATPTGAARILRSQFPLTVTNRAGLGVAWDEETPPVYQDVPPSPPCYPSGSTLPSTPGLSQTTEISISELAEHIEDFSLSDPQDYVPPADFASSSTRHRGGESAVNRSPPPIERRRHVGFSEDDLMQEPPEYEHRRDEPEEDIDIQVVGGGSSSRR